jgi:XRE family aerobic/anaerobic benzoate catabolism transcriptional regulator
VATGAARPASEQSPLLERLGTRVRERRKERALTMREVATTAEVSERFLVLLEAGRANVSVVRLEAIAAALGTTAGELLTEGTPQGPKAPALGPVVALLGLRGAGKTTIGTRAAARLEMPFVELDARIAERAGMSLGSLFEIHGLAYYRRLEREELERVLETKTQTLLATGGSLVTDHSTYGHLRRAAVTVWLRASAEDHWQRVVAQGDARPMANRTDAMKELRGLLRARRALYERAEFAVDTSSLGLERSIERVCKIARQACSSYVSEK